MTTPALPSSSHLVGDMTHVGDHNMLALAAAGATYAANNLSDVADAGSSRANIHVPVLTPAACVATVNVVTMSGPGGATTIASASNSVALPQATINVASATTLSTSGTVNVVTGAGTQAVTYTGVTSTTLTGCSGGTGTMSTGGAVTATFDGYLLAATDTILLTGQTTASQNGPWLIPAGVSGAWTRPTEFATSTTVKGRSMRVLHGTTYGNTEWTLVAGTSGLTVDTGSQTWSQPVVNTLPISPSGSGYSLRDLISCQDPAFGAVADFNMTGTSITISGGTLNQGTIGTVPSDLTPGKTMVIQGLTAPVTVSSVNSSTKVVTFTSNASGAVTGAWCAWGTDNTTRLNSWFSYLLQNQKMGIWPAGKYLITNTIGWPDDSLGWSGLNVLCGGAGVNTARQADLAGNGGTTVVWGGAANGTMMAFNRVSFVHWVGGLALVGQPSIDPSGVFTKFGNMAGIGYNLIQNSTPQTGTGYNLFDDLVCSDMDLGVQFANNASDNNCDTTRFGRYISYRNNCAVIATGAQQMAYTIGFAHFVSTGRGFASVGSGDVDIQQLNVSGSVPNAARTDSSASASNGASTITDTACLASDAGRPVTGTNIPAGSYVGTVTPGTSFTLVTSAGGSTAATTTGTVSGVTLGITFTGIEAHGNINSSNIHVGLLRCENGAYGSVYCGGSSMIHIDSWEEAETNAANLNQFYVDGGGLQGGQLKIGQLMMFSFNATQSATTSPFYVGAASQKSGQLIIDVACIYAAGYASGQAGGFGYSLYLYFDANSNCVADVQIRVLRDTNGNTYNPVNTKLQRGKGFTYAKTTNASTPVALVHAGLPVATSYGYAPRIPRGYSIILATIIGDRGDGTFSAFQRQIVSYRTTGAATVTTTTPSAWTDSVQGTDQISSVAIDATTQVIDIQMEGTVSKTIFWQCTLDMQAWTAEVDL